MTSVEGDSITGHEAAHDLTQRGWSRPQKEVEMVGDQRPCITLRLGLFEDKSKTFQKGFSVLVVLEDLSYNGGRCYLTALFPYCGGIHLTQGFNGGRGLGDVVDYVD